MLVVLVIVVTRDRPDLSELYYPGPQPGRVVRDETGQLCRVGLISSLTLRSAFPWFGVVAHVLQKVTQALPVPLPQNL